jgi:putative ABC transport system permease protein
MKLSVVGQSVKMALANIKNNKMRSFLTMLGIIIGVASVIALITIVSSVTGSVIDQFEALGAGTLTVSAQGTNVKYGLTDEDIEKLKAVPGVEAVAPTASLSSTAVYDGTVSDVVQIEGRDAVYFQHNDDTIQSGRYFNSAEMGGETNVAIVDTDFVTNVLDGNSELGTTFILNGYQYKVIGIKSADSSVSSAVNEDSGSGGTVIIPYKNVLKMSIMKNVTSVEIYYSEDADTDVLEENLAACLNDIFDVTDDNADEAYSINSIDSLVETMSSTETLLSAMLGGIASIALLVGGIGIMNMMLVSVSERTKEIGLRKALGAQPSRIQLQFLMESITLSLLGGFIGIILGEILAYAGTTLLSTTYSVSYGAVALGAGFSAAVGIIFGWMPSRRASRLNPIDALRSE